MTLQNNEVVYTADLMNIAPSNDAQIYGMSGNWILNGLSVVSSNATSITLSAGRAIIQGRLFELKANTDYAVNSQAGFIGLSIDLTQTNSEDNNVVTNNQFTFGFGASEFGDTLQGDVNAFVGLYAVDGKGGYTQNVYNYYHKMTIDPSWEGTGFPNHSTPYIPTVIREGHNVSIQGVVTNTGQINNGQSNLPLRHVSEEFRPAQSIYTASTTAGILFEVVMNPNGQIVLNNFSGKAIKSKSFIPVYFNYTI